jgi:hypothetical protein
MKCRVLSTAALLLAGVLFADSLAGANILQDQFGRKTTVNIGAGRGTLVLISDRQDAGELVELWVQSLAPVPASVDPWFVANLKTLPFFIPRIAITAWLSRKHPVNPILIDWDGGFSSRLAPVKGEVTVYVFDTAGSLLGRASGLPTADKVAELRKFLAQADGRLTRENSREGR